MTDMDVAEAARTLGVTERTIRRWLRSGRLPGYRVGRRIRIPENAVRETAAPYGVGAPPELSSDPIVRFLGDPARQRARREAAARVMDLFAEALSPRRDPEETAEGIVRAIREDEEAKWDEFIGADRS